MMQEIENEVEVPMASVEDVLRVVGNMSSPSSEDDLPPVLSGALTDQLTIIAESYSGKVPIHGRLFAQWLHYAFPRECSFPHTAGKFAHHTLTPNSFGEEYLADRAAMQMHVADDLENPKDMQESDDEFMSQWSKEEELFADYTHLLSPWDNHRRTAKVGVVGGIVIFSILAVVILGTSTTEAEPSKTTTSRAPLRGHVV